LVKKKRESVFNKKEEPENPETKKSRARMLKSE
jgi:hypothetical protein